MNPTVRAGALALKVVASVLGAVIIAVSLAFVFDELRSLSQAGGADLGDVIVILASIASVFAGCALVAQLPESLRVRFRRIPGSAAKRRPVYGLGTMIAVGVGATLGSPLFILIPENVMQYEIVSVVSLLLAALLSVAMAKVYSDMYVRSSALGLEGVGGPSFTKAAVGTRSVRYFVSRVSMWVSNTALAAYSEIVFIVFVQNPQYLPSILASYGLGPFLSNVAIYTIAGIFVGWTILNVFFEKRSLRLLGLVQVVATSVLVVILVYHSFALGSIGAWDLSGLFKSGLGPNWLPVLLINTGYLYLLFFGFQEVQSLERDAVEKSPVPVVSWIKRSFTLERRKYLGVAMVVSVVIAASINIFYGLAVSAYSSRVAIQSSSIPALYIAKSLVGSWQVLLVAVAFLIATVTTFVPAFLAAARHLGALGEDGYMPRSLSNLSWLFTLVAILFLAIGNQGFLVDITDFMVLISLGIISLSALWLRSIPNRKTAGGRALPLAVGVSCFLFGGAVYAINPTVVVFGSVAIVFAYLVFDIIELGTLGAQIFLAIFGYVSLMLLAAFRHTVQTGGVLGYISNMVGTDPNSLLARGLLVASLLLTANVAVDVGVLRRTAVR